MLAFKRIFSAIWYAWHLRNLGQVSFLFVGGLLFLFGAAFYGARDRLPTTFETMELSAAHALLEESRPRYVRLTAAADFSKKIYRTGSWAPYWGNCPPDGEVHDLQATSADALDLQDLLGCTVNLSGNVDFGDVRTVHWRPDGADGGEIKTVSLAPVKGTGERIWVRTEVAYGDKGNALSWETQSSFSGILATYDQALAALPSGLAGHARSVLPARHEAFAIHPIARYTGESLEYFANHIWVPVEGSDRLFLWTTADREALDDETVTGVLVPLARTDHQFRDQLYAHFSTVTGRPLPERIGIIEYPTAEAYNQKQSGYAGMFAILGVLWGGSGLVGIFLYIVAPGLIYGAWKRAWYQLTTGLPPPSEGEDTRPKPSPSVEVRDPRDFHPLMAPFQSSEPVREDPPHPRQPAEGFRSLRFVNPEEEERYLSFIQDFSRPDDPGGGLRLLCLDEDLDVAGEALLNAGQRHPGLAIRLLEVNPAPLARVAERTPPPLGSFTLRGYDYVVLRHAPSPGLLPRVIITAVFDGTHDTARELAAAALARQTAFALMGRVFLIGDSENGPCRILAKRADSSLLYRPR